MPTPLEELTRLIEEKGESRLALLICSSDLNFTSPYGDNEVYIIELGSSDAAGGRAGGFGQRSASIVHKFLCRGGEWSKALQINRGSIPGELELPYHAALTPISLPNGSEVTVSGIVDPDLVEQYNKIVLRVI